LIDSDWWTPLQAALSAMMDMMPREQRVATEEQLKLAAAVYADKGELTTNYFLRALAGVSFPVTKPKPAHLTVIK
jgi:hypothetical protein